jgi:hypothetical protein
VRSPESLPEVVVSRAPLLRAALVASIAVFALGGQGSLQSGGTLRESLGAGKGSTHGAKPKATKRPTSRKPAATPKRGTPKPAASSTRTGPSGSSRGPVRVVLEEGAEVPLAFVEDISSRSADEDDVVRFRLAEDLYVEGVLVAKAGAQARGTVSKVKKAGRFGKDAKLAVRVEHLDVGDMKVKLRGTKTADGDEEDGIGEAIDAIKGVFVKSEDIKIKAGTVVRAFVDADTAITRKLP